jgi:hypothetical protein
MNGRNIKAFIILSGLVLACGAVGGCGKINRTRVKMTATVDAGGVTYSGSTIQEYSCRRSKHIMNDLSHCDVKGEAVVIDIKGRGYLFLVFDMPETQSITSMPATILGAVTSDPMGATNASLPKSWVLTPEQMPLMVKFRDIKIPVSIEAVDPRNLASAFGPEVKLLSVKVETTSERPTFGPVRDILPWALDSTDHLYRDGGSTAFSQTLSQANFTSEYKK